MNRQALKSTLPGGASLPINNHISSGRCKSGLFYGLKILKCRGESTIKPQTWLETMNEGYAVASNDTLNP